MPALTQIEHAGFDRGLAALISAAPVSMKRVLMAEAGSILKACAGRTKVAPADSITTNERLRIVKDLGLNGGNREGDIYINAGIRGDFGVVWRRTRGRRGFQQTHSAGLKPLNRHFGEKTWIDLKEAVADFKIQASKRLPLAKRSAGLARQSWVQIADSLGIALESVPGGGISGAGLAKARAALTSQGRAITNGFSEQEARQQGFMLSLINRLPYGPKAGLDAILQTVLSGRAAYFEQNLSRGVFQDMSKLLRAYPGLTLNSNSL
ncbi:hypothetical protein IMCC26134_15075 [Verrucomicrobia bacterium IMCC26134]|nr:hypothetical protein IMCC26134_15075 [Verrucomicrobia bacterium IMCC26134]